MKFLLPIFFLFFCLITSCNKQSQTPTNSEVSLRSSGSLLMKVGENVPPGITTLTAVLSRSGFDSLTATISLEGAVESEITFEKVPIGTWHLKIDAKNSSDVILYSGQTDVTVVENITTQVNLVLSQVSTGVGSIQIVVSWGSQEITWNDYSGNPILNKLQQDNFSNGVLAPCVLYENGIYKMWYTVAQSGMGIAYATSFDGINWIRDSGANLVLTKGNTNSWDEYSVSGSTVLHDGLVYKMYYYGTNNSGTGQTGLAVSTDGIHWEKYNSPILVPISQTWEARSLGPHSIMKTDSGYALYYHATTNNNVAAIGLAFSSDGIHWQRYWNNPIVKTTENWEGDLGVYFASVIYDKGLYKMVYASRNSTTSLEAFGFATSVDGKAWTKNNANPFFTLKNIANHWTTNGIAYQYFGKFGAEYRIYYSGYGINAPNDWAIGLLKGN